MRRRPKTLSIALTLTLTVAATLAAQDKPRFAGPTENGFLLPNGWTLTPAGEQVTLTDLPLNILATPDGKHAIAATSGFNAHNLSIVDLEAKKVVATETVRQSWFGLAADPTAETLWWAGGGARMIHTFDRQGATLARTGKGEPTAKAKASPDKSFRGGLRFDGARGVLYSLDVDAGSISALDPKTLATIRTASAGDRPYDVAVGPNGTLLYVSDWAGRRVLAIDPADLRTVATIPVGEHPNQIVVHPKDGRIFVACASSNAVSVIDARRGIVTETIVTALFPNAPEGSTPDALVLSPDGKTLFVANADNNCVAAIDVSAPSKSQVKGFIPTGWYPTSLAITPDGKTLLVGVGKGNQTKANPIDAEKAKMKTDFNPAGAGRALPFPYIGTTLSGALSIVPIPDDRQLAAFTETVYKNCPYSDKLLTDAPHPEKTAIPTKVGDPSPIKHVIYVIKENRTYDQVFGDVKAGNGDPALVMFGAEVTPNHHKLAEEYVLLDNLYCNGHVSADGHPWSTAAYATDYLARNWALTYSSREGIDDDDDADLAKSPSGYLWDACARAGLSYRSYGEYGRRVSQPDGSYRMEAAVPGLVNHICPDWGAPKADKSTVRDTDRIETFLSEFRGFEKDGGLPSFVVMSLGEDHTTGTRVGTFTPKACVASNDLALGRLVEAVSKSKYWPETAIFVIEDDAQNGPDHVDAHRTVGLVISPYTKRHAVDSNQYQTVSMIRSMELILGLPPLSQFDAAARPMSACFTDKADPTPYVCEKARIDLDARNTIETYGAALSETMDFSEYDRVDDFALNEILWRSIKGVDAPIPPAVRRAIAFRGPAKGK